VHVDGGHRAFRGGDDGQLGLRRDIAGCVDSLDARLLSIVYPHQTTFRIEAVAESFMEVGRELGAEIEEECVALEWLTLGEDNALQLPHGRVALQRSDRFRPYCDIERC